MPVRRPIMTIRKPATFTALVSALALTASFGLSGCSSDDSGLTTNNEFLQELEVNSGDDNFNDDGFMENWGELPMDWPADIPVHSEKITDSTFGETPDGKSWQVDILPDDLNAELNAARQKMNDAGFTEESWESSSASTEGVFTSVNHRIVISNATSVWGDEVVRYDVEPL